MAGITLVGATTYFFATRYARSKRQSRDEEAYEDDFENLSDLEDYRNAAKQRLKKRRSQRAPPLITFAELYEQALQLDLERATQLKVKVYFDSNDEFVREDRLPELLDSARLSCQEDQSETEEQ